MLGFMLSMIVRSLYNLLSTMCYAITGENRVPKGGLATARVMTIVHRQKFAELATAQRKDFWVLHSHWAQRSVVLKAGVTLYSLDSEYATFVECPDVDLEEEHDFYYVAQYRRALRIILLPIADFHAMAAELGDSAPGKLVFVYSTGRCGSTLLLKMLSALPGTRSISEPDSFTCIQAKNSGFSEADKINLLRSASRFTAQKALRPGTGMLIVKFRSQCTEQAAVVSSILPGIKLLFMYRDACKVSFSFLRAFSTMPPVNLIFDHRVPGFLKRIIAGEISKMVKNNAKQHYDAAYIDTLPNIGLMAIMWVVQCKNFLALRAAKVNIAGVRYEDLVAEPKALVLALVKFLGRDVELKTIKHVLAKLTLDSQGDSALAKKSVAKNSGPDLRFSDEDRACVLEVLSRHALNEPDIVLPGTLLH
jgi:LPS sulfotransferase NodH